MGEKSLGAGAFKRKRRIQKKEREQGKESVSVFSGDAGRESGKK